MLTIREGRASGSSLGARFTWMRSLQPQLPLPARAAAAIRIASSACCVAKHLVRITVGVRVRVGVKIGVRFGVTIGVRIRVALGLGTLRPCLARG